jgi:hypothetical protein
MQHINLRFQVFQATKRILFCNFLIITRFFNHQIYYDTDFLIITMQAKKTRLIKLEEMIEQEFHKTS